MFIKEFFGKFKKEKKEKPVLSPLQRKKLKKRRIRWTIIGIIVIIFIINAINNAGKVPSLENSTLSKVTRETIATSIGATGIVESSSSKIVTTKVTGLRVTNVFVNNGDVVNAGDPICEFDVSDVQKALNEQRKQEREAKEQQEQIEREQQEREAEIRKQLNDAKKQANDNVKSTEKELVDAKQKRDDAKSKVDKAQKALDDFMNSDNTNSISNSVSNTTVANTISNVISNQIANITNQVSNNLGIDAEKLSKLQQELATANAEYVQEENNVRTLEERLDAAKQAADIDVNSVVGGIGTLNGISNLTSTINSLSQANVNTSDLSSLASGLSSSSSILSSLGMGGFSNLSYEEIINNRVVTAPTSGTITNLSVAEDATFNGTEVCLIEGADSLCISSEIGEYDIPDIKEGMKVRIKTEATRNQELEGIITSVATTPTTTGLNSLTNLMTSNLMTGMMSGTSSSSGSSSSGGVSYTIKIDILTISDRLRLGMNAKLSIITNMKEKVLAVPYDAINTREDGTKYIVTVADDFDVEKIAKEHKKEKMLKATQDLEKTAIPNELLEGNTKEIDIKTGIEGTYNVEIESNEIYENMNVVVNKSSVTNSIEALLEMMGAAAGT